MATQSGITEMWAFVSETDHWENIAGWRVGDTLIPLVASNRDRVLAMIPMAKKLESVTGRKIKLLHFKLDSVSDLDKPAS